ncbi:MFS transporter [Phenylobacterium sp.]|jgi:GPH family glycoside/pentoside/hexuronide:cation symporter|uniref:MFS transporter n=1 Tax=Phenylobacterium sp. TaxID=1871053 RepID=UPI0037CBB872
MSVDSTAGGAPGPRIETTKPSLWTKVSYGFGAVAFGVKDNGFSYFLLIFYSQVIGLDARLVGIALFLSMCFDAFFDPILGYWSDNLRSKWGRRHPFMYAAAIPIAATYFLLWSPPKGWQDFHLFLYLLGLSTLVRMLISIYEIPSTALAPELTDDYDERSSLQAYRSYFGWTGGNAMSVFNFIVLFPLFVTTAIPNGQFNPEAYRAYGMIGSGLLLISVLASAIGTHSRIAHLKPAPPKRRLGPAVIFKEIFETLSNRSFLALFISAIFGSIAGGLSAALAFFFYAYFWDFTTQQQGMITSGVFVSAIIGAVLAPIVSRTIGKKKGAIIIGLIAFLGSPMPIVLRLLGVLPDNSSPLVFWFVFFTTMIDVGLIICFQILSGSMMADLVEQAEIKTGRRSEGVFFAASAFIRKVVGSIGPLAATFILTIAGLKAGADPSQVSQETVLRLGMFYVPAILTLWMIMLAIMSTYTITRGGHEANLRTLAEMKGKEGDGGDD